MFNRKPNRLKGYDYSQNGCYFITLCTYNRAMWFGNISREGMKLNKYGTIIMQQMDWLQTQYDYVSVEESVVMPNHAHFIISLNVGNGRDRSPQETKSLSSLLGAFKTTTSKLIHKAGIKQFKWQKSFYDHIIRNERSYLGIAEYIQTNPVKWEVDVENSKNYDKIETKKYYEKIIDQI